VEEEPRSPILKASIEDQFIFAFRTESYIVPNIEGKMVHFVRNKQSVRSYNPKSLGRGLKKARDDEESNSSSSSEYNSDGSVSIYSFFHTYDLSLSSTEEKMVGAAVFFGSRAD